MEIENKKIKVELELDIPTYTANDGHVFNVSDNELNDFLYKTAISYINKKVVNKKDYCLALDIKHEFDSFVPNITGLIYDENNKETYKHFVYYFLKNYYVDSSNSDHFYNGGNWVHSSYNVVEKITKSGSILHEKIINNDFFSIRDMILVHLLSADNVRWYGTGAVNKHVRKLIDDYDKKTFWKFVFDSKMLDINDIIKPSKRILETIESKSIKGSNLERWFCKDISIIEVVIYKCYRDKSLEVLEWIIDTYKFDINLFNNKKTSLFVKMLLGLIEYDIHDTYNNGVVCRLRNYDGTPLSKDEMANKWQTEQINIYYSFIKYLNKKFKHQKLIYNMIDKDSTYYDIKGYVKELTDEFPELIIDSNYILDLSNCNTISDIIKIIGLIEHEYRFSKKNESYEMLLNELDIKINK